MIKKVANNTMKFSVGTDIESISRFNDYNLSDDSKLLRSIFSENELDYCFSKDNPASHLAARFVGKEAVIKALYGIGVKYFFCKDIEILNTETGVPYVSLNNDININIKISLSHSKEFAIAFVMLMEMNEND